MVTTLCIIGLLVLVVAVVGLVINMLDDEACFFTWIINYNAIQAVAKGIGYLVLIIIQANQNE